MKSARVRSERKRREIVADGATILPGGVRRRGAGELAAMGPQIACERGEGVSGAPSPIGLGVNFRPPGSG